jgi:uncharacterized protein (TIGR03089 family)
MTTTTLPDLWRAAASASPGRPFVTYYDDATGARVELSYATTENWIAKTGNLIQDDLMLEPGARVALLLPAHWLAPVWLLACFATGLVACTAGDPAGLSTADLVVAGPDALDAALACPGERFATPLQPFGGRFGGRITLPAGFRDFGAEVPAFSDVFAPYQPVGPERTALDLPGAPSRGGDVVAAAREAAARWGLDAASRVLVEHPLDTWPRLLAGLLAPLAGGASVVLVARPDTSTPAARASRISTERVTARSRGTDESTYDVVPVADDGLDGTAS